MIVMYNVQKHVLCWINFQLLITSHSTVHMQLSQNGSVVMQNWAKILCALLRVQFLPPPPHTHTHTL